MPAFKDVLTKFDESCAPGCTQVIYERYRFNNRKQEAGESISAYVTELCVIAKNCAHDEITPDEILRDRTVKNGNSVLLATMALNGPKFC